MENENNKWKKQLFDELMNGNLAFYGRDVQALPDVVKAKAAGRVIFYVREPPATAPLASNVRIKRCRSLLDIRWDESDVCFLEGRAVRVLLFGYPICSRYVLFRLATPIDYLIVLLGLFVQRRKRAAADLGKIDIPDSGGKSRWAVLQNKYPLEKGIHLSLSAGIGVRGFLDYLKDKQLDYVLLRVFETLPELSEQRGELALLASDEDVDQIRTFLQANPGNIYVDLYSVTGMATMTGITKSKLPYLPPPLARQLLASAMDGPEGARLPASKEAFLSYAFEAVYHKGLDAGIPTRMPGLPEAQPSEYDYTGHLCHMAQQLEIDVDMTLEGLEAYLYQQGWRPGVDTLAKIASRNEWVNRRFFSEVEEDSREIGLSVFILKEGAVASGKMQEMVEFFEARPNLVVLGTELFNSVQKQQATDRLRGGNWAAPSGEIDRFLPAAAIAVLDLEAARRAKSGAGKMGNEKRIKALKATMRQLSRRDGGSNFVHSTDSTKEAWLYIDICFRNSEAICSEVESLYGSIRPGTAEKARRLALQQGSRFVQGCRRIVREWLAKTLLGRAQIR